MPPVRRTRGQRDDERWEGRDPGQIKAGDIVDWMVMTWPGNPDSRFPAEYQPEAVKVIDINGSDLRVLDQAGHKHDIDRKEIRAK